MSVDNVYWMIFYLDIQVQTKLPSWLVMELTCLSAAFLIKDKTTRARNVSYFYYSFSNEFLFYYDSPNAIITPHFVKWTECEAISFHEVQDKSARQPLLWPGSVEQGRGKAWGRGWGRRCQGPCGTHGTVRGTESVTCRLHCHCMECVFVRWHNWITVVQQNLPGSRGHSPLPDGRRSSSASLVTTFSLQDEWIQSGLRRLLSVIGLPEPSIMMSVSYWNCLIQHSWGRTDPG